MNRRKRRRLAFAVTLMLAGAGAALLVVIAVRDNVQFFLSPSQVATKHVQPGIEFRIGGLVKNRTLRRGTGANITFVVTDGRADIPVIYQGVLPALFREGRGVVALGSLTPGGTFSATEILAKHDERYMPRDVVEALKRTGRWQEDERSLTAAGFQRKAQ